MGLTLAARSFSESLKHPSSRPAVPGQHEGLHRLLMLSLYVQVAIVPSRLLDQVL